MSYVGPTQSFINLKISPSRPPKMSAAHGVVEGHTRFLKNCNKSVQMALGYENIHRMDPKTLKTCLKKTLIVTSESLLVHCIHKIQVKNNAYGILK